MTQPTPLLLPWLECWLPRLLLCSCASSEKVPKWPNTSPRSSPFRLRVSLLELRLVARPPWSLPPFTPYPYRKTEYSDPTQAGLNLWNPLTTLGFKGATAPVANGAVASPSTLTGTVAGSTGSGLNLPKFNINTNTLSELGRALYTSQLNKQIDTRVERPMLSAPTEVSTPVRGNFYAQNVANNQANNLVRDSQSFKTSDGSLQMLGNLEAQRNAAQIRMQGAQQNSAAIQQSQQMNIQNQMQNAQARNNVANENIQTNARATQAERQAENEKHAQVNAPLLEFWKNEDNKGYYQQQQNKSIDTQIGGLGEEAKVRNQQQQLSQAMYKVWNDQSIPDNERQARYQQLSNQQNDLQNRLTNRLLQLRKNPYQHFTDDANYYNIGPIAGYKDGGAMKLQVQETKDSNEASRDAAKAINTANKDSMQDDTKKHLEAMKEISDMIKLALK